MLLEMPMYVYWRLMFVMTYTKHFIFKCLVCQPACRQAGFTTWAGTLTIVKLRRIVNHKVFTLQYTY
jgi:hypothetical protein